MPHLSPLSWAIAPLVFFIVMMFIYTMFWFVAKPNININKTEKTTMKSNKWHWM